MRRDLRTDVLLVENIRALLSARGVDASALAIWCGHRAAWISKIMSFERGCRVKDLGRIADFFGLSVADLLTHGISPLTERRRLHRRSGQDRRSGEDRRKRTAGDVHPELLQDAFNRSRRLPAHDVPGDDDSPIVKPAGVPRP
jgi:hypothetical protein